MRARLSIPYPKLCTQLCTLLCPPQPRLLHMSAFISSITFQPAPQSFRKFGMTYLRKATPKIELGIRQTFFGHERPTTMEGTYEDDPTIY